MKKLALLLSSLLVTAVAVQAKEVITAPEVVVEEVVVEEVVQMDKEVPVEPEPVFVAAVIEEKPEPALRVTNFGLWTENDNSAGSADGDIGLTYIGMNLGLATENWVYGVSGYKAWTLDSKEGTIAGGNDNRFQLEAWRQFNKEGNFKYALGTRARFARDYDRYYLRGKYSYGMLSGWGDYAYESNNGVSNAADNWYYEAMPLNITFFDFLTLGYYVTGEDYVGQSEEWNVEQQIRAYIPLLSYGKFSSGLEYRVGVDSQENTLNTTTGLYEETTVYDFGDYNAVQVGADYQVTENSVLSGYYLYEVTNPNNSTRNDYYGEFGLAWDYKF